MQSYGDLGAILGNTVDLVCACLADTPNGTPGTCTVYWSTPPDDLDCGDCDSNGLLVAWLERMAPVKNWPSPYVGPSGHGIPITVKADIAVRLVRPCWPILRQDIANPFPARSVTEPLALNLDFDASAVFCCILNDLASNTPAITDGPCLQKMMGALEVDRNRGGCAGFTVRFSVGLGACCVSEGS